MAAGKQSSPWVRKGKTGSNPQAPGSYGGYWRMRQAPRAYPTTSQQQKIGNAGRAVGEKCKGQTGSAFFKCRHEAIRSVVG